MKRRNVLIVCALALAAALSSYFIGSSGSPSSATQSTVVATIGGAGAPIAQGGNGPSAVRPAATPLAPTSSLAGVSMSAMTSGLQAHFNSMLSANTSALRFDSATNAPAVSTFLHADQGILKSVNVIPTVVSSTPNADGSQSVNFTVTVMVGPGRWPTNFGTLTGTLYPDGTLTLPHATICTLVSPLDSPCSF